uniref:Coiled-coil domain containing 71 like n=1 Tax=Malurus cyaneus samueli TaxID=2593467 RepID=A0A8C5TV75_9PASS
MGVQAVHAARTGSGLPRSRKSEPVSPTGAAGGEPAAASWGLEGEAEKVVYSRSQVSFAGTKALGDALKLFTAKSTEFMSSDSELWNFLCSLKHEFSRSSSAVRTSTDTPPAAPWSPTRRALGATPPRAGKRRSRPPSPSAGPGRGAAAPSGGGGGAPQEERGQAAARGRRPPPRRRRRRRRRSRRASRRTASRAVRRRQPPGSRSAAGRWRRSGRRPPPASPRSPPSVCGAACGASGAWRRCGGGRSGSSAWTCPPWCGCAASPWRRPESAGTPLPPPHLGRGADKGTGISHLFTLLLSGSCSAAALYGPLGRRRTPRHTGGGLPGPGLALGWGRLAGFTRWDQVPLPLFSLPLGYLTGPEVHPRSYFPKELTFMLV